MYWNTNCGFAISGTEIMSQMLQYLLLIETKWVGKQFLVILMQILRCVCVRKGRCMDR